MLTISAHAARVSTLPDVGAPASLLLMAALGLLVLFFGVVAMLLTRRT